MSIVLFAGSVWSGAGEVDILRTTRLASGGSGGLLLRLQGLGQFLVPILSPLRAAVTCSG